MLSTPLPTVVARVRWTPIARWAVSPGVFPVIGYGVSRRRCRNTRRGILPSSAPAYAAGGGKTRKAEACGNLEFREKRRPLRLPLVEVVGFVWVVPVRWAPKPHTRLCAPWGVAHSTRALGSSLHEVGTSAQKLGASTQRKKHAGFTTDRTTLPAARRGRKDVGLPTEGLVMNVRDGRTAREAKPSKGPDT